MDYSILIVRIVSETNISDPDIHKDVVHEGVYYVFGIIDFLQKYNIMKQLEHRFKSIGQRSSSSSTDVFTYAIRLMETVQTIII